MSNQPERTRRRRGPVSRALTWIGTLLMLVGAGLLGYVGWQYYGTDWLAERDQAAIRGSLDQQWRYATVSDLLGPQHQASQGESIAVLRVPRFGADYAVPILEGVSDDVLAQGIGHFDRSAGPGQLGNFALAAHRITHGEPFAQMLELRPGDEVIVETSAATYTYVLDTDPNDLTVTFDEGWVVQPVPLAPPGEAPPGMPRLTGGFPTERLITLTTCSELFHTDNRSIAFGHLVSVESTDAGS